VRRRFAWLLLLSALLGACSPLDQKKAPSVDGALALMFENKYTAASDQLQGIIKDRPGDGKARAAYALLLNYRMRQRDALREAQEAARLAPNDGFVLTILTRVQDWNDQTAAAAASGEQAVKAAPQSALARAFYGEALADLKRYDEAVTQLRKGGELAARGPAYDRAEVERNWGNYYRQRRENQQALAHLKEAANVQPNWVERVLELARFSVNAKDLPAATGYLKRAALLSPDDPALREELGTVALVAQDYQVAKAAFEAAAKLQPRSAVDHRVLGAILVALDRDVDGAIREERAALAIDPADVEAGFFLVALLRDLKQDESAARQAAQSTIPAQIGGSPFLDLDQLAESQQAAAVATINQFRRTAGLSEVGASRPIHQGALAHAHYVLFNGASPSIRDLGIHRENRDGQGFTGETVLNRAQHFGYPTHSMAEDITHRGLADAAVRDWINSVFHRIPILRADLLEVGYGDIRVGPLDVQVLDMAFRDSGSPGMVVFYPAANQQDVPPAFLGNEVPDPAPGAEYPVGYPITATFDRRATASVQSFHLRDPSGADLPGITLMPSSETENAFAFLAKEPLQTNTSYAAEIAYTINGVASQRTWRFRTRSAVTRPSDLDQTVVG